MRGRFLLYRFKRFGFRFNLVREDQHGAIGVPQAIMRVNENAQWRRPQPLGPHRPALNGRRRIVEGIYRPRPRMIGERIDSSTDPAVKRVWLAVDERLECPPHSRTGIADQNERRDVGGPQIGSRQIGGGRPEEAAHDQAMRCQTRPQFRNKAGHGSNRYCRVGGRLFFVAIRQSAGKSEGFAHRPAADGHGFIGGFIGAFVRVRASSFGADAVTLSCR
jgi:hypothetical protein